MFGMGHWEILIILLVVLLIFGAKRIPEMAQGMGKGIREFRKAVRDVQDEVDITNTGTNSAATPPNEPVARQKTTSDPPDKTQDTTS